MNIKLAKMLALKKASDDRIQAIRQHQDSLIPDYGFVDADLAKQLITTDKAFHFRSDSRPTIACQIAEGYNLA